MRLTMRRDEFLQQLRANETALRAAHAADLRAVQSIVAGAPSMSDLTDEQQHKIGMALLRYCRDRIKYVAIRNLFAHQPSEDPSETFEMDDFDVTRWGMATHDITRTDAALYRKSNYLVYGDDVFNPAEAVYGELCDASLDELNLDYGKWRLRLLEVDANRIERDT